LAKRAGCDPRTVAMICRGDIKSPSEQMMIRLKDAVSEFKNGQPIQRPEKEETNVDFVNWLSLQMEAKSLSNQHLAKLVGCHPTTVSSILNRRIENPSNEMMAKIRIALNEEVPTEIVRELHEQKSFDNREDVWDDFNPHDLESVPNKPGVYALFSPTDAVMYVGMAQNVRSRIANHREKKWFLPEIIEYGMLFYSDDHRERKKIEDILIKFLRTRAWLNKSGRYRPKQDD
jgi:transcriptional regulator with XRE-family HTH domain